VEIYPLINLEKMKKSIAILGFLVSTFGTVNAQLINSEDTRENFSFGAKIGANYSNVWDEKGQDFQADGKIGFAGGLKSSSSSSLSRTVAFLAGAGLACAVDAGAFLGGIGFSSLSSLSSNAAFLAGGG
jgi:hypothetical protein